MRKHNTTSFQPDPELLPILKEQAENEERSVSYMVNKYIREAFENRGLIKPKERKKPS